VKPGTPALQSTRILDQLRKRIRYMHCSLSTEQVYVYWVRFFIRWLGNGSAMRHPRDMGAREVEAFLTHLATDRKVSASTHNQALGAILFLYREVLAIELPWLNGINRPAQKRRIPSVLTKDDVAGLFAQMYGEVARSRRRYCWQASPNRFPSTLCAIPLPPICCRRAPTSERCRSCSVIRTCPQP
jgi:site-specific recombinase XerD